MPYQPSGQLCHTCRQSFTNDLRDIALENEPHQSLVTPINLFLQEHALHGAELHPPPHTLFLEKKVMGHIWHVGC